MHEIIPDLLAAREIIIKEILSQNLSSSIFSFDKQTQFRYEYNLVKLPESLSKVTAIFEDVPKSASARDKARRKVSEKEESLMTFNTLERIVGNFVNDCDSEGEIFRLKRYAVVIDMNANLWAESIFILSKDHINRMEKLCGQQPGAFSSYTEAQIRESFKDEKLYRENQFLKYLNEVILKLYELASLAKRRPRRYSALNRAILHLLKALVKAFNTLSISEFNKRVQITYKGKLLQGWRAVELICDEILPQLERSHLTKPEYDEVMSQREEWRRLYKSLCRENLQNFSEQLRSKTIVNWEEELTGVFLWAKERKLNLVVFVGAQTLVQWAKMGMVFAEKVIESHWCYLSEMDVVDILIHHKDQQHELNALADKLILGNDELRTKLGSSNDVMQKLNCCDYIHDQLSKNGKRKATDELPKVHPSVLAPNRPLRTPSQEGSKISLHSENENANPSLSLN